MFSFLTECASTTRLVRNFITLTISILTDLPQSPGLLPKWQLFVAATAVFNAVQNFATLNLTRRVYNHVPPANGARFSTLQHLVDTECH